MAFEIVLNRFTQTFKEITKIVPCHESALWYDRKCCLRVDELKDILRSTTLINEVWNYECNLFCNAIDGQVVILLRKFLGGTNQGGSHPLWSLSKKGNWHYNSKSTFLLLHTYSFCWLAAMPYLKIDLFIVFILMTTKFLFIIRIGEFRMTLTWRSSLNIELMLFVCTSNMLITWILSVPTKCKHGLRTWHVNTFTKSHRKNVSCIRYYFF